MADDDDLPAVVVYVFDTGPLITLAVADSLDYLKLTGAPVCIPDAVFYEATSKSGALGAQDVLEWAQANPEAVRIMPTAAFAAARELQLNPTITEQQRRQATKDLGERAAMEVAREALPEPKSDALALIVTEDERAIRIARRESARDDQVRMVTTRDFLEGLEEAGRINSAEEVYRRAEDAGRHASRQRAEQDARTREQEAMRRVMSLQQRRGRSFDRER